ncbi:MAG TPA: TIGR00730 family Rossman fold protein [Ktedonobacterales bacterium]|nr:TIGR00730 family Rossman fold protein [Ktedonobacterales bacterium]
MHTLCVFCGSSRGTRPEYAEMAQALGREMAARGLELVYGGSSIGMMGTLADAVLAAGGEVTGVLPRGLFRREVAHTGLTRLREVGSMHERKLLMIELADGFIALPGGFGTYDELFEVVTWAQIGLHQKPIGLLDVCGFFAPLLAMVAHAAEEGFLPTEHRNLLLREETPTAMLDRLQSYTPPAMPDKWADLLPRP